MTIRKKAGSQPVKTSRTNNLSQIQPHAAGIDIGSEEHFVAVPEGIHKESVRKFSSFTSDLHRIADWLKESAVTTVAMESTGVYWIPLYEILEKRGFEVNLVDPKQVKNVSGRKTDVADCQWIQQLHSYGLLRGAFRPPEEIREIRTYVRSRSILIEDIARQIQRMQKALSLMNVLLHKVVSDITGKTGMAIIRQILNGNRDSVSLARLRDPRCTNSEETISEALSGHYTEEHLYCLSLAVKQYDFLNEQVADCELQIEKRLSKFVSKAEKPPASKKKSEESTSSIWLANSLESQG